MDLVDLRDSFISRCFEERGWESLLSGFPSIYEPLIKEFYANASLKELG